MVPNVLHEMEFFIQTHLPITVIVHSFRSTGFMVCLIY